MSDSQLSNGGGNTSSIGSTALSVAGAISSPVASLINLFADSYLSDKRNKQAIEQWERENEYNLPKNQIKRLQGAGLNPALMYSNGSDGLISARSPEMSMPVSNLQGVDPLTAAQIRNLDAQTESVIDSNARANELQPFNIQNVKANNAVLRQQVKNLSVEEQNLYVQWSFKYSELAISKQLADAQCSLWNSQKGLNDELKLKTAEEYRQMVVLFQLKKQGIALTNREIQSRIGVNDVTAAHLKKIVDYYDAYYNLAFDANAVNQYNAETSRLNYQKDRQVAEYQLNYQEEMKTFERNLKRSQANLQQQQAYYYEDYRKNPARYRSKSLNTKLGGITY